MVLPKFALIFGLSIFLIIDILQMFTCGEPCKSAFDTRKGLHRHENSCVIFTTVQALKLERRRELVMNRSATGKGPRPLKKARTQEPEVSLIAACNMGQPLINLHHR